MTEELGLSYIKHSRIDTDKWNKCIENADNNRVYAYEWHLDRIVPHWDALVYGDYKYVMPLPIRKKMGIKYLYQPLFSQQLGIFPEAPMKICSLFYGYLVQNFRYAEINLNAGNVLKPETRALTFNSRKNFLLPLFEDYNNIADSFSKNTKRNIAKSEKHGLNLIEGIRLEEYMQFKQKNLPVKISDTDLQSLKSLIAYGQRKSFGKIYGVYTQENELCAAVYFCKWKDRVIYFNAASNETSKKLGGMYFLVNSFIRQNAGKLLTLDFEGSMIPGVARFYSGFGATPEIYHQLKFNRLPLLLKWLKR